MKYYRFKLLHKFRGGIDYTISEYITLYSKILFPKTTLEKYCYLGTTYLETPKHWDPHLEQTIVNIARLVTPKYIPLFILRWLEFLGNDNSVVRVRWRAFHNLLNKLIPIKISQIKEKFGELRFYYDYSTSKPPGIKALVAYAEMQCASTCVRCGHYNENKHQKWYNHQATNLVAIRDGNGWLTNLCDECHAKK